MIVEHFKNQDPVPVYRRFQERGRLAPEGLRYVSSWVDEKLERCFQLMETEDRKQLDEWILNWNDLVEFEVYPVMSSAEAAERVSSFLSAEPAKWVKGEFSSRGNIGMTKTSSFTA